MSEIPAGQLLVVITRHGPPDSYTRLIANERVGFIDWARLKLTEREAQTIVARRAALDDAAVRILHERSGGWAAGLTLLLEEREGPDARDADPGRIFDYFAGLILERASAQTRRFLIETSMLPDVPVSLARALTGCEASAEILEDLYQRHLFVHRRPGAEPVYWYHALFREFLHKGARQQFAQDLLRELSRRAGLVLEQADRFEDAFDLYAGAERWDSCTRMLLATARNLLARGRWRTLEQRLRALPAAEFEREPRLLYWTGMARMAANPREARNSLESAFQQLGRIADYPGRVLAAAAIIDAIYFEWASFHDFNAWIGALDAIGQHAAFDSVEDELRVQSSLLTATSRPSTGCGGTFASANVTPSREGTKTAIACCAPPKRSVRRKGSGACAPQGS